MHRRQEEREREKLFADAAARFAYAARASAVAAAEDGAPRSRKRARRGKCAASVAGVADPAIADAGCELEAACGALRLHISSGAARERRVAVAAWAIALLLSAESMRPFADVPAAASPDAALRCRTAWLPARLALGILLQRGTSVRGGGGEACIVLDAVRNDAAACEAPWLLLWVLHAFPNDAVAPLVALAGGDETSAADAALAALNAFAADGVHAMAALGVAARPAALLMRALDRDPPLCAVAARLVARGTRFEWAHGKSTAAAQLVGRHAAALGGLCCINVLRAVGPGPGRWTARTLLSGASAAALLAALLTERELLCELAAAEGADPAAEGCEWSGALLRVCDAAGAEVRADVALRALLRCGERRSGEHEVMQQRWALHLACSLCPGLSARAGRILLRKVLATLERDGAASAAVAGAPPAAAEVALAALLRSPFGADLPERLAEALWASPALASAPRAAPSLRRLPLPLAGGAAACACALRLLERALARAAARTPPRAECAAAAAAATDVVLRLAAPTQPRACAELVLSVAVDALSAAETAPVASAAWLSVACALLRAGGDSDSGGGGGREGARAGAGARCARAAECASYALRRLGPIFLGRRADARTAAAVVRRDGSALPAAACLALVATEEAVARAPLRELLVRTARAACRAGAGASASATVAAIASRLLRIATSRFDASAQRHRRLRRASRRVAAEADAISRAASDGVRHALPSRTVRDSRIMCG